MSIFQDEPVVLVGTLAELANYTVSVMPIGYLYFARDAGPNGTFYVVDIVGSVRSWKQIGGSSSSGPIVDFIYTQGAPDAAPVYGNFANMMAAIALLPQGALPKVTFMPPAVGGPNVTIPLAGMPLGGWNMFLGSWSSFTPATGTVVVELEDGVILKDLSRIEYGLVVSASPSSDYGVFQYSVGLTSILQVVNGGALQNLSAGNTLMNAPPGSLTVLALSFASPKAVPPSTGPYVRGTGGTVIGSQIASGPYGQLPDGWIDGNGTLIYQNGADANNPITPNWTSGVSAVLNSPASRDVIFQPGGTTNGNVYATAAEVVSAINRADGAARLYVDPSLAPAIFNQDLDGKGLLEIMPAKNQSTGTILLIADGFQIKNLRKVSGNLTIQGQPTSVNPLAWDYASPSIIIDQAILELVAASSVPMAVIPPGANGYTFVSINGGTIQSLEPTVPCIAASGGSTVDYRVFGRPSKATIADNAFGDDGSCTLAMNTDASGFDLAALCPLFAGTISVDIADEAPFVFYDATTDPPGTWVPPVPVNTDEAIRRLAAAVSGLLGGAIP